MPSIQEKPMSPLKKIVFVQKILLYATKSHIEPIVLSTVHTSWHETFREGRYGTATAIYRNIFKQEVKFESAVAKIVTSNSSGAFSSSSSSSSVVSRANPLPLQSFLFHLCNSAEYGEKYFWWVIKSILDAISRSDADFRNPFSLFTTPLCAAVISGQEKVVAMLLTPKLLSGEEDPLYPIANPNVHKSAASKRSFSSLLGNNSSEMQDPNEQGSLPLFNACMRGNANMAKMLLDAGAIMFPTCTEASPLFAAIKSRSLETVKVLLEYMTSAIHKTIETIAVSRDPFTGDRTIAFPPEQHIASFRSRSKDNVLQVACDLNETEIVEVIVARFEEYDMLLFTEERSRKCGTSMYRWKSLSAGLRPGNFAFFSALNNDNLTRNAIPRFPISAAVLHSNYYLLSKLIEYSKKSVDLDLRLQQYEDDEDDEVKIMKSTRNEFLDEYVDRPDARGQFACSPLLLAILHENVQAVAILLFEGECNPTRCAGHAILTNKTEPNSKTQQQQHNNGASNNNDFHNDATDWHHVFYYFILLDKIFVQQRTEENPFHFCPKIFSLLLKRSLQVLNGDAEKLKSLSCKSSNNGRGPRGSLEDMLRARTIEMKECDNKNALMNVKECLKMLSDLKNESSSRE